ncbi:hypothetical protein [Pseudoduganella sp.]|uniref:hypothetical protein n=1 Tax=Pseudoduganella sp. TaxID=1880898 RepID=UPI0035ADB9BE
MKTYLAIAAGLPIVLVGAVAGTNYLLDPYLIHQWDSPQVQRLRQPVEKLNAWGKTYAIAVYRPDTIYLGNSRTELGLAVPPGSKARVFNAALSGSTLGDALRMLGHARQAAPVRRVIWGLDAPSFTLSQGNGELEAGLLARDGSYLARRRLLDLQRAVSIDMTRESLDMLRGRNEAVCHASLARYGQRDGVCMRHRIAGWGGTGAVVNARTREFLRGEGPSDSALPALEGAIRNACGVQWRLYVNPTHAMTIDVLYWAGKGGQYEAWLTALAGVGQRLRAAGCDVRIYDFSGFNSVTSESIPRTGDTSDMRNYWETSHYREHIGDAILARLDGGPLAADGFGRELQPAGMAQHIAALRAARTAYLNAHPYEAGRAVRIARDHAAGL